MPTQEPLTGSGAHSGARGGTHRLWYGGTHRLWCPLRCPWGRSQALVPAQVPVGALTGSGARSGVHGGTHRLWCPLRCTWGLWEPGWANLASRQSDASRPGANITLSGGDRRASQVMQGRRVCLPVWETQEAWVRCVGLEDPFEDKMAAHSSVPAWRIPWTEEPGEGPQSWT